MALSDIVRVSISLQSAGLVAAGFGVPLIAGDHTRFVDLYRVYATPAAMIEDGFETTDLEYIAALSLMSQAKKPAFFVIGRREGLVEDDLTAIRDAMGEDASWYCTILTSRDPDDIAALAAWCEGNSSEIPVIAMAQTSQVETATVVYNEAGTDIGSILKAQAYTRTALWWHSDDAEYLESAIAGKMLPEDPGSESWALKDVAGITPDTLSGTERAILIGATPNAGKNVNIYTKLQGSANITRRGTMSSGDWIDVIRFVDFLKARMSEGIAGVMLTRSKVPFTDSGIKLLANQVRGVLQAAQDAGKLNGYTVTAPLEADISAANKQARILDPPITFTAEVSGAIHECTVEGEVTQ